jgi:hypothetical protein
MKKLLKMYSYLIQPTIYKITSRAFLGITFSLLWNHFINENETYIMAEKAFFLVGAVLLTMAWFNYLKLDGISIGMAARKGNKGKDESGHQSKNIIDFLEEDVTSDELEEDEEILSAIIANIFTGICFLISSIIAIYL